MKEPEPLPQILTPCSSGRASCGESNSPEFEFWMVRNPSFPQPNLLSADELFSGGILLPLHHLNLSIDTPPPPPREPEASVSDQVPKSETTATESAELSATSALTSSKRWRVIFRKSDKKTSQPASNVNTDDHITKERETSLKENRREKKKGGAGSGGTGNGARAAELNINIWPFSRSRSAGNGGSRPRSSSATRKVSSAPCSRSNSRGESKSRKWPSSPSRGVHLGRSSPVWQVRRSAGGRSADVAAKSTGKGVKKDGNEGRQKIPVAGASKTRVLSLNVPMCMGYRQHLSCRGDENSAGGVVAAAAAGGLDGGGGSGEGARGNNLFNIRSLFTRKVY